MNNIHTQQILIINKQLMKRENNATHHFSFGEQFVE